MGSFENEKEMRGLSSRERSILSEFVRKGRVTVEGSDVAKVLNVSRPLANKILSRLEKKGWLQRSKRGVYTFIPLSSATAETVPEDPWALAMDLFKPCYISGFSAAEYWGLTEQVFNEVVVYTTQRQRKTTHRLSNVLFRTHHISEDELFGMTKTWRNNIPVLVADLHRTIVDVLDHPELGGGGRHVMDIAHSYWKSEKAEPKILFQYAMRLKRGVVFKRLGFTAELWGAVTEEWLEGCRKHISAGVGNLDPSGSNKGKILTRWKLRVNIPLEEYE